MKVVSQWFTQAWRNTPSRMELDWVLLGWAALLVSVGIVMVASSSLELAAARHNDPWYLVKHHLAYLALGLTAAWLLLLVPLNLWQKHSNWCLVIAISLLLLVLMPGIGKMVNGSQRWIIVAGVSVQASEVAKLLLIVFFAGFFAQEHEAIKKSARALILPLAVLFVVISLLLLEPDFGNAVVITGIVMGMLFLVGIKLWQCVLAAAVCGGAGYWLVVSSAYRSDRFSIFRDPFLDPYGDGYNLVQSLIAFGRGHWSGVGLGESVQKLFYLKHPHTDFIFAVVAEEFGLLGAALLILIFVLLIGRMLQLSRRAMLQNNTFVSLVAFGVAILFASQVFINAGAASTLLPPKGITMPFVSYGGSSLIISCLLIALLVRFEWELFSKQPELIKNPKRERRG